MPSRVGWKSGEQLEFLLSQESSHKRHQDLNTLDHFWPRVFEGWYDRWPIVATPAMTRRHKTQEDARVMMQKARNKQIKNWFNNRRGTDSEKVRGSLKLDANEKRKLAPVQAYCSYAWVSTLRPIVLARWQQQKATITFVDEDDPTPDPSVPPEEACIPLSFKLDIAKEMYNGLTQQQKDEIDVRREEDQQKRRRKITEITNDEEREEKLQLHQKNQALVQKSLLRILKNLEDQVGCITQVFIGSVSPKTGRLNIQKFCGGKTKGGVDFETYWGDDWDDTVERKFTGWAAQVFGAQGSEERSKYLLPSNSNVLSQESTSEENPSDEVALGVHSATQVPSSQPAPSPSQPVSEPSHVPAEHSQPALTSSRAPDEDMAVDARPDSIPTLIPPQPPKVPYRVRNSVGVPPGARSRKDSIDGAPEAVFDLHAFSGAQDVFDDDEPEAIVDLCEFIDVNTFTSLGGDSETETQASSSQSTTDGSIERSILSPSPQLRQPTIQKAMDCSESAPAHAFPEMGDDYDDLPSWMVKRGQWNYLVSTAGGPLWENLLRAYMRQERRLEFTETGVTLTTEDRPSKISEYFQYAHKPSRGDTVTVPRFGVDVVNWWGSIQPEWRRSGQDTPQDPSAWSYILSGGSKGLFLVLMCLSWWHRAHTRFLQEENARRTESPVDGTTPNLDDLPTHDPEWLRIVRDVEFVMNKAQDCIIPTRAASTPSRRGKRRHDAPADAPRKKRAVSPKKTRSRA